MIERVRGALRGVEADAVNAARVLEGTPPAPESPRTEAPDRRHWHSDHYDHCDTFREAEAAGADPWVAALRERLSDHVGHGHSTYRCDCGERAIAALLAAPPPAPQPTADLDERLTSADLDRLASFDRVEGDRPPYLDVKRQALERAFSERVALILPADGDLRDLPIEVVRNVPPGEYIITPEQAVALGWKTPLKFVRTP